MPLIIPILLFSFPAHAQLNNENLLVAMPDGYKVGFQDKNAKQQMTEMVPRGQSVKDWTDMVTVQIFFNMTNVTPRPTSSVSRSCGRRAARARAPIRSGRAAIAVIW